MILVMTGTNPYSFDRLIKAADEYCKDSGCDMFIQLGHTVYLPEYAKYERFLSRNDLVDLIHQAELVVVQGGFGSIADCMLAGKKVVAVPRMPEYNESPDRQDELVGELEKQGRLIAVYDIETLGLAIDSVLKRTGSISQERKIPKMIQQYIALNSKA